MHPLRWLNVAFGAPSRVRILRLLAATPSRLWTEREIAREVGLSPNGANKAVRELDAAGVVETRRVGRAHAVRLSLGLAPMVRRVFRSEQEAWDDIVERIRRAVPKDTACYVFGSSVRGKPSPESDVDLLVVSKDLERAKDVAHAIEVQVHERFPARLSIIALGAREASRRVKGGVVRAALESGERLTERAWEDVA